MITEFGGLSLQSSPGAFAYTHLVSSDTEYAALLYALFEALRSTPLVSQAFATPSCSIRRRRPTGWLTSAVESKLPLDTVRYIVTGEETPFVDPARDCRRRPIGAVSDLGLQLAWTPCSSGTTSGSG